MIVTKRFEKLEGSIKNVKIFGRMLQLARHTEEARSNFGTIPRPGNSKHQSSCVGREQERGDGSGNLFIPKLDPPTGFTDSHELSEAECDLDRGRPRGGSQRHIRDFVIAV